MNPNWTGRAARTLSECRFTDDANPFIGRRAKTSNSEIAAYILALLVVLLFINVVAR